jgi:hypothetical protein
MSTKALHLAYLIGGTAMAVLVILFAHAWLVEHDERLMANQIVKVNEQAILRLEDKIEILQKDAATKKAAVIRQMTAIKTVPQAIIAIPTLTEAPLNARQAIDNPLQVSVDAVTLAQTLGTCKATKIDLEACQATVGIKDEQLTAQKAEITALKKKRNFWARLKENGIVGAISFGVGALL